MASKIHARLCGFLSGSTHDPQDFIWKTYITFTAAETIFDLGSKVAGALRFGTAAKTCFLIHYFASSKVVFN